ncbi:hypothetical protein AB9K21_05375 [Anaplasma phagocytophilum]|uniref:Uncharacterized protein n=2 Tax=Anaplasma phagocytophilum TaxID=948 RepID=A0A0F3NGA6_ANAPH|nr:hypothetical protein APHMUC_1201 [Anaplasma phagocytophilum str. ApMUC09]KJV67088.1 hypothetical protein APHNP_0999 [Anaplasma phagocytophilum str. ApNP]SCV65323.1 hypothetical protein ANAPH2_01227 [Anaplasma phagocytophilum]
MKILREICTFFENINHKKKNDDVSSNDGQSSRTKDENDHCLQSVSPMVMEIASSESGKEEGNHEA